MNRHACALLVVLGAVALGEDPKAKAAREELERQLNQMVGKVPTKVRIDFLGLEEPNYVIEDATFELDGRTLTSPLASKLSEEGTHPVWNGDVTPGKHSVKVMLVVANRTSAVLSDEGGYKWTLRGERTAEVNAGIEVHVEVTARRDGTQTDVGKRFALATTAKPVMIATLDDGSIPEPPKKPVLAVVDAGTPATTAEQLAEQKKKEADAKAAEAAEAKRAAAEEKKAKVAAAAEAKRLAAEENKAKAAAAAEERKAKAAAALEAKRAAAAAKNEKAAAALAAKKAAAEEKKRAAAEVAEEKKRLAEEKKLAAIAAAEEKKRLAQEALEAKNKPPVVAEAAVDAGAVAPVAAAEPIDAGAPEPVDTGAPEMVALAPVDAGPPAPVAAANPPVEDEGPPWLLIGIAGGAAALIFLVVVARRRARPPTLDD